MSSQKTAPDVSGRSSKTGPILRAVMRVFRRRPLQFLDSSEDDNDDWKGGKALGKIKNSPDPVECWSVI